MEIRSIRVFFHIPSAGRIIVYDVVDCTRVWSLHAVLYALAHVIDVATRGYCPSPTGFLFVGKFLSLSEGCPDTIEDVSIGSIDSATAEDVGLTALYPLLFSSILG